MFGVLVDGAGQRRAKPGQVGATVRVGNRVGKAQDLVGVAVVVLQNAIDKDLVLFRAQINRLGMDHLLVLADLPDELLDPILVVETLALLRSFVLQDDFQPRIQKGQFAQTVGQDVEIELRRDREDCRVRLEGDQRSGLFGFADDLEFPYGHTTREFHVVNFAVTRHFHLKPVRERIDAFGADTMQSARVFVGALAKLAAGMKIGEHEFHGGNLELGMNIHGNSTPVVANGDRSIHVNSHVDLFTKAGQVLIHGVVQHLEYAVVKSAFIGIAYIHPGTFSHCFEALQFVDLRRVIFLRHLRCHRFFRWGGFSVVFRGHIPAFRQSCFFRHKVESIQPIEPRHKRCQ